MSLLTFTDRKSGVKRNEIMSLQQILLLSKLWHKINTAAALILPHPPCRASSTRMGGGWGWGWSSANLIFSCRVCSIQQYPAQWEWDFNFATLVPDICGVRSMWPAEARNKLIVTLLVTRPTQHQKLAHDMGWSGGLAFGEIEFHLKVVFYLSCSLSSEYINIPQTYKLCTIALFQ